MPKAKSCNTLPCEMWTHILDCIDNKEDLKNMTLVSKYLHSLVSLKLWKRLKLKDMSEISGLAHLPIKEIIAVDSDCDNSHLEIISRMPSVQKLDLCNNKEISEKGLAFLMNLQCLEYLLLSSCKLDDSCMGMIGKIKSLKTLILCNNRKVTDSGIQHLAQLKQLTTLDLRINPNVTASGLSHISQLTQLRTLNLSENPQITDSELACLSTLTNLNSLNISYCCVRRECKFSSTGLEYLKALPIEDLNLRQSGIDDSHLSVISTMAKLKKLDISGSSWTGRFSANGLSHLKSLTTLENLNISDGALFAATGNTGITAESLEHIVPLQLKSLNVSDCHIEDAHLEVIGKMKALKWLSVGKELKCTDVGLAYLTGLTELEYLDLSDCSTYRVTKKGVALLIKPTLTIKTWGALLPPYGPKWMFHKLIKNPTVIW